MYGYEIYSLLFTQAKSFRRGSRTMTCYDQKSVSTVCKTGLGDAPWHRLGGGGGRGGGQDLSEWKLASLMLQCGSLQTYLPWSDGHETCRRGLPLCQSIASSLSSRWQSRWDACKQWSANGHWTTPLPIVSVTGHRVIISHRGQPPP